MIRSTKVSLKFANPSKRQNLRFFVKEYRRVVSLFVDILWKEEKVPLLLSKKFTREIVSWLSARMIQCAGKQASGIVRGCREKQEQRLWMLNELQKRGQNTSNLEKIINETIITKPVIRNISIVLDNRFVKIGKGSSFFDGWVNITCIGKKFKLVIPFKKHRQFNKLSNKGQLIDGLRMDEDNIIFAFDIQRKPVSEGKVIGVDVGITNCCATSEGFLSKSDTHGYSLSLILKKLERRKKGSNGFRKAATHRKNFINWSVNQLNLHGVKEVRCEGIKNLRKGKKTSRFLFHWTYADVFEKLERFCEDKGVLVSKVNPAYTSQTCPICNTLGKRRGKVFSCSCGYENDADLNAALNLAGKPIVSREILT